MTRLTEYNLRANQSFLADDASEVMDEIMSNEICQCGDNPVDVPCVFPLSSGSERLLYPEQTLYIPVDLSKATRTALVRCAAGSRSGCLKSLQLAWGLMLRHRLSQDSVSFGFDQLLNPADTAEFYRRCIFHTHLTADVSLEELLDPSQFSFRACRICIDEKQGVKQDLYYNTEVVYITRDGDSVPFLHETKSVLRLQATFTSNSEHSLIMKLFYNAGKISRELALEVASDFLDAVESIASSLNIIAASHDNEEAHEHPTITIGELNPYNVVQYQGESFDVRSMEMQQLEMMGGNIRRLAVDVIAPGGDSSDPQLAVFVAYNRPNEEPFGRYELDRFQRTLARLPDYLRPTIYIPVLGIPITGTGKVDRAELRRMGRQLGLQRLAWYRGIEISPSAPDTHKEAKLALLWANVLGMESCNIGRQDNFFNLGGDSLKAIKISALATQSGLFLSANDILGAGDATLLEMAKRMKMTIDPGTNPLPRQLLTAYEQVSFTDEVVSQCQDGIDEADIEDMYYATPEQDRMLRETIQHPKSMIFHHVYEVGSALNIRKLQTSFDELYKEFPILRTRLIDAYGRGSMQVVLADAPSLEFNIDELSHERPFEPDFGKPLTRLTFITNQAQEKNYFIWSLHHSVVDAWSMKLLWKGLAAAYNGEPIQQFSLTFGGEDITPTYGKFIKHIYEGSRESEAFWQTHFQEMQSMKLFESAIPDNVFQTDRVCQTVDLEMPNHGSTSTASMIHTVFAMTLGKVTGSPSVTYRTTGTGRCVAIPGIEGVVGPTTTSFPVHIKLPSLADRGALVQRTAIPPAQFPGPYNNPPQGGNMMVAAGAFGPFPAPFGPGMNPVGAQEMTKLSDVLKLMQTRLYAAIPHEHLGIEAIAQAVAQQGIQDVCNFDAPHLIIEMHEEPDMMTGLTKLEQLWLPNRAPLSFCCVVKPATVDIIVCYDETCISRDKVLQMREIFLVTLRAVVRSLKETNGKQDFVTLMSHAGAQATAAGSPPQIPPKSRRGKEVLRPMEQEGAYLRPMAASMALQNMLAQNSSNYWSGQAGGAYAPPNQAAFQKKKNTTQMQTQTQAPPPAASLGSAPATNTNEDCQPGSQRGVGAMPQPPMPFGPGMPFGSTMPFGPAMPFGPTTMMPFGPPMPSAPPMGFGGPRPGPFMPFGPAMPPLGSSMPMPMPMQMPPGGPSIPFGSTMPAGPPMPFGAAMPSGPMALAPPATTSSSIARGRGGGGASDRSDEALLIRAQKANQMFGPPLIRPSATTTTKTTTNNRGPAPPIVIPGLRAPGPVPGPAPGTTTHPQQQEQQQQQDQPPPPASTFPPFPPTLFLTRSSPPGSDAPPSLPRESRLHISSWVADALKHLDDPENTKDGPRAVRCGSGSLVEGSGVGVGEGIVGEGVGEGDGEVGEAGGVDE